jgi:hypothetical protein
MIYSLSQSISIYLKYTFLVSVSVSTWVLEFPDSPHKEHVHWALIWLTQHTALLLFTHETGFDPGSSAIGTSQTITCITIKIY